MTDNQGGLVKKLLFPGFADSGANMTFQPTADDTNDDVALSEASTQVRNNLSVEASALTMAVAESPQRVHSPCTKTIVPASDESSLQPPPFFASTRPAVTHQSPPHGPESPPKSRRHLPQDRSISNVAQAGVADGEPPSLSIRSFEDRGDYTADEKEEKWDENFEPAHMDVLETKSSSNSDAVDRATQVLHRVRSSDASEQRSEMEHQKQAEQLWEEEATPEQTAFGKELLFARKLQDSTDKAEVLSTASEMGTVIDAGGRMAEVEDMEAHVFGAEETQRFESPKNEQYSKPVWNDDDLALPMLDTGASKPAHQTTNELPEQRETSPESKTSAIISNAFRRLGSGLTRGGTNARNSISAPSTPRALPQSPIPRWDKLRSPRTPGSAEKSGDPTPSSFLLRSPGSAAFVAANSSGSKKLPTLLPRFTTLQNEGSPPKRRDRQHFFAGIPENDTATATTGAMVKPTIPFQIARSCLSFDAYDTSMDDQYEFTVTNNMEADSLYHSMEKTQQWIEHRGRNPDVVLRNSMSWDINGASQASAFRAAPYVRDRTRIVLPDNHRSAFQSSPPRRRGRVRIMSDCSSPADKDAAVELKTPQRIEIEREDALDILACLVERGVSLNHHDDTSLQDTKDGETGESDRPSEVLGSSFDISGPIDELRALSKAKQNAEGTTEASSAHKQRILVLNELKRSHEYALEMSRAAQSASSWLKSIGRSQTKESEQKEETTTTIPVEREESKDTESGEQPAGESASEEIDVLTLKAMLHSAQMEAKEKAEQAERLNEELAKCRAEIGRLMSASQAAPFKSPNRSILDETNDEDETEDDESGAVDRSFDTNTSASPFVGAGSDFLDSSFLREAEDAVEEEEKREVVTLRSSLDEANDRIRKLHGMLKDANQLKDVPEEAPVVHQAATRAAMKESPSNKDERTVTVRMLNAENFSTDWETSQSLPPPPDHGLRSPIVAAVLEQWTADSALHESLLSWIDYVLAGGDPESIPPLTISSLDHEVRDGFMMHVLPLLLRRPDIGVDVKMRAHRRTTYDIAVGVESIGPFALGMRRNLETTSAHSDVGSMSVTHSATTALISNGVAPGLFAAKSFQDEYDASRPRISRGLSYDEMTEDVAAGGQQSGIMSALGGALGGLLTRRGRALPEDAHSDVGSMAAGFEPAGFAGEMGGDGTLNDEEDAQPYHRVVSAPPGRIGVTFVEYRGHAMVSDVAPDSPLGGWIFPSDILIAIDELPVSGMRVRDIIKVLKDRSERQRALRVISSHAMNEFTMNQSTVMTDTPS